MKKKYQIGIDKAVKDYSGWYDWSKAIWIETQKKRIWIRKPKFIPNNKIKCQNQHQNNKNYR